MTANSLPPLTGMWLETNHRGFSHAEALQLSSHVSVCYRIYGDTPDTGGTSPSFSLCILLTTTVAITWDLWSGELLTLASAHHTLRDTTAG